MIIFIDKHTDPEDVIIKFIRNMETLNSDDDNDEEQRGLLVSPPNRQHTGDTISNEIGCIQFQADESRRD